MSEAATRDEAATRPRKQREPSVAPPLELTSIRKSFGDVTAVDGIDLTLADREVLGLVGPSGCGKSTLLRIIAGLIPAEHGTVRLGGELVDDGHVQLPPERRPVGLVFQEHALFPHLTVRDNVAFGVRDVTKREKAARVEEMLGLVSLDRYGDRYPHELSGGERQRVALARALAPAPALMLFDEPFASLDHNLRVQLRHDVLGALRATRTPAVFVTHDQREALTIGDRIAVMRGGRIVQLDTPAGVFHEPVDEFVAAFMGEASFLPVDTGGAAPSSPLGPVDGVPDGAAGALAMVRPDDVVFARSGGEGPDEVVAAEYHGAGWVATVRLASGHEVLMTTSHLEPPTVGERGRVELAAGHRQVVVPPAPG